MMSGRVWKRSTARIVTALLLAITVLALLASGCSSGPDPKLAEQARMQAEAEQARRQAEADRLANQQRQAQELREVFGPVGEPPRSALPPEERPAEATAPQPTAPASAAVGGAAPAGTEPATDTGAAAGVTALPPAPASGAGQEMGIEPFIPPGTLAAPVKIDLAHPGPPTMGTIPFDAVVPALPPDPTVRVAIFSAPHQPDKARNVALILGTYEREQLEERMGMAVHIAYVAQSQRKPTRVSEIHYRESFLRAAQSLATALPAEQWIGPMTPEERRQESVDVVVYLGETYR